MFPASDFAFVFLATHRAPQSSRQVAPQALWASHAGPKDASSLFNGQKLPGSHENSAGTSSRGPDPAALSAFPKPHWIGSAHCFASTVGADTISPSFL